jgi:hypothetical protein
MTDPKKKEIQMFLARQEQKTDIRVYEILTSEKEQNWFFFPVTGDEHKDASDPSWTRSHSMLCNPGKAALGSTRVRATAMLMSMLAV